MSVLFSAPIALALSIPYLLVRPIRHQLGERGAMLAFAALMVAGEWTLHAALPFGVWGAAANTQLGHLDLLQLASGTGLHGVSFLVYLVAASAESLLAAPSRGRGGFAVATIGVVGVVMMLGQARLAASCLLHCRSRSSIRRPGSREATHRARRRGFACGPAPGESAW